MVIAIKWFKHISDSLTDPFIFDLIEHHGAFGYLSFFGILEIYAREFKVTDGWKLDVSLKYIRDMFQEKTTHSLKKFLTNPKTNSKWKIKMYEKSGQERVEIYIPKFLELLDEHTRNKLRRFEKDSGVTHESLKAKDKEEEEEEDNNRNGDFLFKKKVPIPANFYLTDEMKKYAGKKNYVGDLDAFTEHFILSCKTKPKQYQYQNWYAAWQKWLLNDMKYNPKNKGRELVAL